MVEMFIKAQSNLTATDYLARSWQRHWSRILQIGHHDRRNGQHEAAHDLLRIVVQPKSYKNIFNQDDNLIS